MDMFLGVLIGIVIGILFSFFGVAILGVITRVIDALKIGAEFLAKNRKKWKEK